MFGLMFEPTRIMLLQRNYKHAHDVLRRTYKSVPVKRNSLKKTSIIEEDTPSDHATIMILSGAFSFLFGYCTYHAICHLQYQHESMNWPQTNAFLEYVSYKMGRSSGVASNEASQIVYSYHVGLNSYRNTWISCRILPPLFGKSNPRVEEKAPTGRLYDYPLVRPVYRVNNIVPVYYNPSDPSISCLETSESVAYEDVVLTAILALATLVTARAFVARGIKLSKSLWKLQRVHHK